MSFDEFFFSVSNVLVFRRPLLFFFRFQGLNLAVEDVVRLLVVASLDVNPFLVVTVIVVVVVVVVLVVIVVIVVVVVDDDVVLVNEILLADVDVLFLGAPALTHTGTLAVVTLFLS